MAVRSISFTALLLFGVASAQADPAGPALHGIAVGMTPAQAVGAAQMPCSIPPYSSDLVCKATDGSEYRAIFSAGQPSIALTVQHNFCSHGSDDAVLAQALGELHVPPDRAHGDPNGYTIDLDGDSEAVLNADDGTCPANSGKHYVLLVRSDGLIKMSSKQAAERAKAAKH